MEYCRAAGSRGEDNVNVSDIAPGGSRFLAAGGRDWWAIIGLSRIFLSAPEVKSCTPLPQLGCKLIMEYIDTLAQPDTSGPILE